MSDSQAIVIDLGSDQLRAGLSGDPESTTKVPTSVFANLVGKPKGEVSVHKYLYVQTMDTM